MLLGGVDTNLIISLHALLKHANVTRAAKEVGLGQSSMSHALGRLRLHFGDALLVPVGRRLVLTERARELRVPVAAAVAQLETIFAAPQPFDPRTSRRVFRLLATDNIELFLLPALTAMLQKLASGVALRVASVADDWSDVLLRGDADLKIGRRYPTAAGLVSEVLSTETYGCVVRRGHRVRARPSAREFAAWDHLVVAPTGSLAETMTTPIDQALAKQGLERRVVLTVPHFVVAPSIVAATNLVLTAPDRLLGRPLPAGLRRIQLPVSIGNYELSQVWAARADGDAGHRWLRALIAEIFAS